VIKMSTRNTNQIGPSAHEVTPPDAMYNHPANVYEKAIGHPARNSEGQRAGQRMAEEGLVLDGSISGAFVGGVSVDRDTHTVYEVQQARGRGRLGAGHPVRPPHDAGNPFVTDPTLLGTFAQALDRGDPGQATNPMDMRVRDGARPNLAPRDALALGERVNNAVVVHTVPEDAPWRARPNQAEIGRS
jgi:hypothetical protein